jgi:F-type H+-transporting ATPase subunit delta
MNTGPIAHRYAKALLKFIQETSAGEKLYSQACVFVLRMQEIRQLADAVQKHPEVSLERKLEILESALGEPMADALRRFVVLVYEHKRIEYFERMLYSFIEQYRSANGIMVGKLVTAAPVAGLKERLQTALSEKTGVSVLLEEDVNPEILGGFILNIDDLMMDASVEGQFRLLRRELIDNNNRIV